MTAFEPATPETAHRVVGVDQSGTFVVPVETPSLADFLIARYDEVERAAHAATAGPWEAVVLGSEGYEVRGPAVPWKPGASLTRRPRLARCGYEEWDVDRANAEHIAMQDPTAVVADIEAKRQIVDLADFADEPGAWPVYMSVLRLLALPYADHPDYRQEWKP